MAFSFRLESVLEHRRYLEDLARQEFARKLGAQKECENQIKWLTDEHHRARGELLEKEAKGMPAKQFVLANEYVTVLRLTATRESARLPMLKKETETARRALMKATTDRKALESLKTAHRKHWEREQLLLEQKILDEAAVSSYLRKS